MKRGKGKRREEEENKETREKKERKGSTEWEMEEEKMEEFFLTYIIRNRKKQMHFSHPIPSQKKDFFKGNI